MALDPALIEAVKEASSEAGHPDSLAKRLLAWLTRMSDGELSREADAQFYADVRKALEPEGEDDAN
jgi:hypothetical protein